MDFRSVKSLMIGGMPVAKLLIGGRLAWQKAKPEPEPVVGGAYIETDGTSSYLDLAFVPTESMTYKIDFRTFLQGGIPGFVMGASAGRAIRYMLGNGASPVIGSTNPNWANLLDADEGRHVVEYTGDLMVDGVTVATGLKALAATRTMILGHDGREISPSRTRFYAAKFWGSGVLIRDLVPYSGPRGVGMLDKVNDVLYVNAGGGTLTYGEEGGDKEAYVQTKGLSDSFWYAMPRDLGLVSRGDLTEPSHFAFSVDMEIMNELDANVSYGFMKTSVLDSPNMNCVSGRSNPYITPLGPLPSSTYSRNFEVTDASRKTYEIGFDPERVSEHGGANYVTDGTTIVYGTNQIAKLPYESPFYFGGSVPASDPSSATRSCEIRVFGIKIWQFYNLVADLVPYRDGSGVGMMDRLSGRKFPGSNLEYGEE